MTFWGCVLAAFIAISISDVIAIIIRSIIKAIELHEQKEERRIGFGEELGGKTKKVGDQMRKIGFGEND